MINQITKQIIKQNIHPQIKTFSDELLEQWNKTQTMPMSISRDNITSDNIILGPVLIGS